MSCLFDSLSHFLSNVEAHELRLMITKYLSHDPVFFEDTDHGRLSSLLQLEDTPVDLETYVKNMSDPNTWGGAIEINAFCNMLNARVEVHVMQNNQTIEFLPKNTSAPPVITFRIGYTGNHYIPISIK